MGTWQTTAGVMQIQSERNKEEQGRGMKDKGITMAQWVNRLRNNIFVNLPPLPLSCEISGVHLAQLGLTAGWLAGWQAGRRNAG